MASTINTSRLSPVRLLVLLAVYTSFVNAASNYWLANVQRRGSVPFSSDTGYQVFRNVVEFGAVGDGVHDDTAAINQAISSGNRCGLGCDSSTTVPALIYFPPGTYLITAPLVMYYFSQLVGDAIDLPIIKAAAGFNGFAMLDSDVYIPNGYGSEWYTNQNNFYRQVRNFVIDLTALPQGYGTGIHWQVAQATSLQNLRFVMVQGGGTNNKQTGIYMENGSGGFMADLVFIGGNYGAFLGNQQFTTRNMTFTNCNTAIYMNFDWVWTFKSLSISNCGVGIDMSNGGTDSQTTGSVLVLDSTISARTGIITNFIPNLSGPGTAGTLVVENVDFRGSNVGITSGRGNVLVAGGQVVDSFAQGNAYTTAGEQVTNTTTFNGTACVYSNGTQSAITAQETTIQQRLAPITKSPNLLDGNGRVFERSKPQYEALPASSFLSAKSFGCAGDGIQDDTTCVQNFLNSAASGNQVAYFDHGAYIITSTVLVPTNIRITGEIWPMIMVKGTFFSDQSQPRPAFQVGQPGSVGVVEMSDLVFQTMGPCPGAIVMQWNVAASSPGAAGLWDVHWRIGGSAGTGLQSDHCSKNPSVIANADTSCEAAFMLLHVTPQSNIYMENTWLWVADHELDRTDHNQINIYNGRGVLIESEQGPVWMYGTSAEHSVLYNYQVSHASNVWMGVAQSETAYFQANPNGLQPFIPQESAFTDPTFATCTSPYCIKTWALRVVNSTNVYVYGVGAYSFFENYDSGCLDTESCQTNIIDLIGNTDAYFWGVSTKASTWMITYDGTGVVPQAPNQNTFCETIVLFEAVSG